jgi:hypothetical protein
LANVAEAPPASLSSSATALSAMTVPLSPATEQSAASATALPAPTFALLGSMADAVVELTDRANALRRQCVSALGDATFANV